MSKNIGSKRYCFRTALISIFLCLILFEIAILPQFAFDYQKRLSTVSMEGDLHDVLLRQQESRLQTLDTALHELEKRLAEAEQGLEKAKESTGSISASSTGPVLQCDDLMSRPGSTYADGSFITRHTTPHTWTPRKDGSREFNLASICSLKRYSAEDARQCLANKHMNFVGDSLSRYQFYSLAYFIDKGEYPPRFPRPMPKGAECTHIDEEGHSRCSNATEPNICMEGDWHKEYSTSSWNEFYSMMGGSDDGGIFEGRMECGCSRSAAFLAESVQYVSREDANGYRTHLSSFQELGWGTDIRPLIGFDFTGCALNGTCRMPVELVQARVANNMSYDWKEDFVEGLNPGNGTFRTLLPPVDVAIYNRGLWGPLEVDRAKQVFPLLYNWTAERNGRCFFKSTTAKPVQGPGLHAHEIEKIRGIVVGAGCSFLDYGHITRDFGAMLFQHPLPPLQEGGNLSGNKERSEVYWDKLHFYPWVYEELNNVLLNVLCNWKTKPTVS